MAWLIHQVFPLLVFLLFTSPAPCFGYIRPIDDAEETLPESIDNVKQQLHEIFMPAKTSLDEAKDGVKESLGKFQPDANEPLMKFNSKGGYLRELLDKYFMKAKKALDETKEGVKDSLGNFNEGSGVKSQTLYNDEEQLFLWSPYEQALKFLKRAFGLLLKSGFFKEEQDSGFLTDEEGGMINILKEKTDSHHFSKKGFERSMNYDMSGYMIDTCNGDVSLSQMKAIADALKRASIDTVGKEHSSVKEMMKFIDCYRKSNYGGSAEELPLWTPYERAMRYLKRVAYYLEKSRIFKPKVISELTRDAKGDILDILKEKMKSGEISKKDLEKSMNFVISGFMIDICHGEVSKQQMDVISKAMKRASRDTTGKKHSSATESIKFIECYEKIVDGRADNDGGLRGSATEAGGDAAAGDGYESGLYSVYGAGDGYGSSLYSVYGTGDGYGSGLYSIYGTGDGYGSVLDSVYGAGAGSGSSFGSNARYNYSQKYGAYYGQGTNGGTSSGAANGAAAGTGSGSSYPSWTGYGIKAGSEAGYGTYYGSGAGAGAGSGISYDPGARTGTSSEGAYGSGAATGASYGSAATYGGRPDYDQRRGDGAVTGYGQGQEGERSGSGSSYESGKGADQYVSERCDAATEGGDTGSDPSDRNSPVSSTLSECGKVDNALYDIWMNTLDLLADINPLCFSDRAAVIKKFWTKLYTDVPVDDHDGADGGEEEEKKQDNVQ